MGLLDSTPAAAAAAADESVLIDGRAVAWLADIGSFSMAAAAAATAATVNGSLNGSPRSGCGGEWADGRDNCRCNEKCECGSGR